MTSLTVNFGSLCQGEADFSAITDVNILWTGWPLKIVEFYFLNVSQSITSALLSGRLTFDGGGTYDSNSSHYITAGISKWTEGLTELRNLTGAQWPLSVDMADATQYGNCGKLTLFTAGVAGGNNVNSAYWINGTRTDAVPNVQMAPQSGFHVGSSGSRANGIKLFFPGSAATMSGTVIAKGVL